MAYSNPSEHPATAPVVRVLQRRGAKIRHVNIFTTWMRLNDLSGRDVARMTGASLSTVYRAMATGVIKHKLYRRLFKIRWPDCPV